MKYVLFASLLLFIACKKKESATPPFSHVEPVADTLVGESAYDLGHECVYKKTDKSISTTYPFDKSDKIELVSYKDRVDKYSNNELISDGQFTVPDILERKSLGRIQKDSLFAILFNHSKAIKDGDPGGSDCYDPHHSILFYEKGKVIAFYEICFMCGGTRQTKGIDFGEFCDEKLCILQKFFQWNKVKKNFIDEMCE